MTRREEWSVKARMPDAAAADRLVGRLAASGRNVGRLGRRVSIAASDQRDAQTLAGELELLHPDARIEVRGD
jgi:hypothetical protein